MPETGLFTRITDGLKAHFNPLHGSEDGLLFWIEELPQPRDTGSLIIACGGANPGRNPRVESVQPGPQPRAATDRPTGQSPPHLHSPATRLQKHRPLAGNRNPQGIGAAAGSGCGVNPFLPMSGAAPFG